MKKLNNKGFSLMEIIVALAMVTIIATFASTAIVSTKKSAARTAELSGDMDTAMRISENFLADGSQPGETGTSKMVKTSGGMSGFPDIALTVKDSSTSTFDGESSKVKYIAFRRSKTDEESADPGAERPNEDVTEDEEETTAKAPEEIDDEKVEPTTEATTEAPTEPPTEPVTEAPTETTTEPPSDSSGKTDSGRSYYKMRYQYIYTNYWGYPVNTGKIAISGNLTSRINNGASTATITSGSSGIASYGGNNSSNGTFALSKNDSIYVSDIRDYFTNSNVKKTVLIQVLTKDGETPDLNITGGTITEVKSHQSSTDSSVTVTHYYIEYNNKDIAITNNSAKITAVDIFIKDTYESETIDASTANRLSQIDSAIDSLLGRGGW